ncbi:hypothetical protein DFH11DRAFT_1578994 [Phellopilus nigrolimitatus]|nr:hypothetical protein DFH11DRAFT_1578994 [Phellopilus nigrolimitatus]
MSSISSVLRTLFYPLSFSFGIINRLVLYFSSWLPSSRRHLATDPASVADRWVRELEEETGAVRESRLANDTTTGSASGADAQAGPGPSTLNRRTESARAYRKQIPEFYLGSYEAALSEAQKEARPLCVVIVTEEHDDVPDFKRTTLVDPEFNQILKSNNFLVWGGDVRDYEASQAAQKLGATTYPFVAFVGLQPRSGSRGSTSSPVLTVLSRHQGPSTPADAGTSLSSLGPTSARALCEHLTSSLLPRVSPFLGRLRSAHVERLTQRRLREEQDEAFARAAQADRERLAAKLAEERRAHEEIEMQELRRSEEEAARQKAREERETKEANRLHWYRYARRCLLPSAITPSKDTVRIGVRLPGGQLQIRHFSPADSVTSLYIFVATQLIPKDLPSSEDPSSPPSGFLAGEAGVSEKNWSFKLALAYPRREVRWAASTSLSAIEGLKGGGQLVIESIPGQALVPGDNEHNQGNGDSDYDSEE